MTAIPTLNILALHLLLSAAPQALLASALKCSLDATVPGKIYGINVDWSVLSGFFQQILPQF